MRVNMFYAVSILALAAPAAVIAQEEIGHAYTLIGVNGGNYMFVDTSTLQTQVPTYGASPIRAWVLTIYSPRKKIGKKLAHYSLYLGQYDCASREAGALYGVDYATDGSVISQFRKPQPEMQPVVPDSIGEVEFNGVCEPTTRSPLSVFENVGAATDFADFAAHDRKH